MGRGGGGGGGGGDAEPAAAAAFEAACDNVRRLLHGATSDGATARASEHRAAV